MGARDSKMSLPTYPGGAEWQWKDSGAAGWTPYGAKEQAALEQAAQAVARYVHAAAAVAGTFSLAWLP